MRRWADKGRPGTLHIGSLPESVERQLRNRLASVLARHGQTSKAIDRVSQRIVEAVSWAYAGRNIQLTNDGPGRPPAASGNILSIDVADILSGEGVRGNWLAPGDEQEDGAIGLVAELEAIAQTAYKQASGADIGTAARPARVTEARKLLSKITRE